MPTISTAPERSAAAIMRSHPARSTAIGFSATIPRTPWAQASSTISGRRGGQVQMETTSRRSRSSISAAVAYIRGIPCSLSQRARTSSETSAPATTSTAPILR